jgi:hypothetical protein
VLVLLGQRNEFGVGGLSRRSPGGRMENIYH